MSFGEERVWWEEEEFAGAGRMRLEATSVSRTVFGEFLCSALVE